ncbi:MAG: hypothetical protein M1818_003070 [Claussenomyces sp. TS43310]|nr:MAG: hypothetical protein M1818_003070 [Claussenomyces sp. TS43310]
MASINGTMISPTDPEGEGSTLPSSTKRKRSSVEAELKNDAPESKPIDQTPQATQQQITDFLEVLKSYDTSPSILNRQIPTRESSTEPQAKRQRSEAASIIARASSEVYSSLEDVMTDVKTVCSAMLEELRLPSEAVRTQYSPMPTQSSELASRITIFKKKTEDILRFEKAREALKASPHTEKVAESTRSLTNGTSASKSVTQLTTTPGENKLVLTLYGNAPGAKQLFSSLQEPVKVPGGRSDVTQLLREAGLPNGISTTQMVPIKATGLTEEKKTAPTLGELFCSSSSVPFQPPKPSRHTTRSSTVGWYQPGQIDSSRSRTGQSYHGMEITTGQWLDYNGTSIDPKQKQRERALSLGNLKASALDNADEESTKLEALFKNAYSSFAPSRDDTGALVPEGQLNRVWWQQVGEKTFDRLVENTVNITSPLGPSVETENAGLGDQELEGFEEAVKNWDESMVDPSLEDVPIKSIEDKDVEEILQEISELLEALNSYQRNRYLSRKVDEAAKPTEAETATYNTLKAQLSLMVAMLPPYAVAKLNSDQLGELDISTKIPIVTDSFKGVMEEDEEAQRAKVAEMASRSRSTQSPSTHRSSTSLYGNQYASTSRPAVPATSQFYSPSQTPIRPPSTSTSRAPSTAPAQYAQRPSSGASYRPQPAYAAATYPHQLPRPSQPAYVAPTTQYYQTPSQSYSHQQGYGSQTAMSTRYQAPTPSYPQRQSSLNGPDYRYGNGGTPRQPSPQKPQTYSPQAASAQPSRSYGTPTPSLSQERRYYQPSTTNGASVPASAPTPSQQAPGTLGATGYHTVMTAAEQSTMMERQRAQLAQQQGAQHQARSAAQAGTANGQSNPPLAGGNTVTAR